MGNQDKLRALIDEVFRFMGEFNRAANGRALKLMHINRRFGKVYKGLHQDCSLIEALRRDGRFNVHLDVERCAYTLSDASGVEEARSALDAYIAANPD